MVRFLGQRGDNPLRQVDLMKAAFPSFTWRPNRRGGLTWNGCLQPTAHSREYGVRIEHDRDSVKTFVDKPRIRQRAPHLYRDGALCLFWPKEWAWHPKRSLAETLIPWTALWLYFYEVWLETGEWMGPSSPHEAPKDRVR